MSAYDLAAFLAYWEKEGEAYARHGDYAWMAGQLRGRRVLEVGCGLGFGTAALLAAGCRVLAVDSLADCLAATRARCPDAALELLAADLTALDATARAACEAFAPDAVVCWLMGAPAEISGAGAADGGRAVAAYREKVHRAVAELAAALPGVRELQLVDRTAIPWQAKDIGRDTLVRYHAGKTLAGLPFVAERQDALYRKLDDKVIDLAQRRPSGRGLPSVVPTLAALLAKRKI